MKSASRTFVMLLAAISVCLPPALRADDGKFAPLKVKLDEYTAAIAGDSFKSQASECDFLISECKDSLARQFTALYLYDHYLNSRIMGDEAVAVHIVDRWFAPGTVKMKNDLDLLNAKVFADFNRSSLVGEKAPELTLLDPSGTTVAVFPVSGNRYTVLYFYDTDCSTCRLETPRLKSLLSSGNYDVRFVAVYTGDDESAWARYRTPAFSGTGAEDYFDPGLDSDFQRKYGVLQTPKLFLIAPDGTIIGRGLDSGALRILLDERFTEETYVYGSAESSAVFDGIFSVYGDSLKAQDVSAVGELIALKTLPSGKTEEYKRLEGDLLYYLSSRKEEVFREGTVGFIDTYILGSPLWNTPSDTASVIGPAQALKAVLSLSPIGEKVPDISVHGELVSRRCLFSKGRRMGRFQTGKLRGKPLYILFHTSGCGSCSAALEAVGKAFSGRAQRGVKVLLVDMDELFSSYPSEAEAAIANFDLSAMPFAISVDRKGTVTRKYVDLVSVFQ